MKVFEKTGQIALSSRMRLLTSKLTDETQNIFELYNIELTPNWFLVFFILSENGEETISNIAEEIGHSQPSVTKIIKQMKKAQLVDTNLKSEDKRRNLVGLSEKGYAIAERMKTTLSDVNLAIEELKQEATTNLWETIKEWEFLLQRKSLLTRVKEQMKLRESQEVKIVPYHKQYRTAFKSLNEEWIKQYFVMEKVDYDELENPEDYVINKGGEILVALYNDTPVGVCALVKMNDPDYQFELSKLAVSPLTQGKGVGKLLVNAIIQLAKDKGCSKLFLQSNTILGPAINLYYKVGFKKVSRTSPLYDRVNIQMELEIEND